MEAFWRRELRPLMSGVCCRGQVSCRVPVNRYREGHRSGSTGDLVIIAEAKSVVAGMIQEEVLALHQGGSDGAISRPRRRVMAVVVLLTSWTTIRWLDREIVASPRSRPLRQRCGETYHRRGAGRPTPRRPIISKCSHALARSTLGQDHLDDIESLTEDNWYETADTTDTTETKSSHL